MVEKRIESLWNLILLKIFISKSLKISLAQSSNS